MKRLFAFGDSFTKYSWPTWPHIIGQNFDLTLNYGYAGCGNFVILHRAMQALLTKNIGPDDTVIVQWTDPSRIDSLTELGYWAPIGEKSAVDMVEHGLGHYNSDSVVIIKQLTYMAALIKLLEETGCNWYFAFLNKFSMVHLDSHLDEFGIDYTGTILEREYPVLKQAVQQHQNRFINLNITDYIRDTFGQTEGKYTCWYMFEGEEIKFLDAHPTPTQFLSWVKNCAMKVIGDLDINPMSTYAHNVEQTLAAACPNYTYDPRVTQTLFDDFEIKNNYKEITRNYHV